MSPRIQLRVLSEDFDEPRPLTTDRAADGIPTPHIRNEHECVGHPARQFANHRNRSFGASARLVEQCLGLVVRTLNEALEH